MDTTTDPGNAPRHPRTSPASSRERVRRRPSGHCAWLLAPLGLLGCLTPLYELPVDRWRHYDPEKLAIEFPVASERCRRSAVVPVSLVESRGNVAAPGRIDDTLFRECMHKMGWWIDYEPPPDGE